MKLNCHEDLRSRIKKAWLLSLSLQWIQMSSHNSARPTSLHPCMLDLDTAVNWNEHVITFRVSPRTKPGEAFLDATSY